MKLIISTPLIKHQSLKKQNGVFYFKDYVIGFIMQNMYLQDCFEFSYKLDKDVKDKLKPIIEKWINDSEIYYNNKEKEEEKNLNNSLRDLLK